MSEKLNPETQFSIYKINFEEVEDTFNIKKNIEEIGYVEEVLTALINGTLKILRNKPKCTVHEVKFKGFSGIIFKTIHDPIWKSVALQVIKNNEISKEQILNNEDFLTNSSISYVLFYPLNKDLFVLTGGYGSNYINKFTSKNFGLYLLPKIIKKNNHVLKQIIENNLTGNQASNHRSNRESTSFVTEQDMSSIFRQLAIEVDRKIAEELGICFSASESENKKINIINKDSLVIRRSFSLKEISKIFIIIQKIEKRKDNFALNYLVSAKKRNIKNIDLLEILVQNFVDRNVSDFLLVGDEYEEYFINANTYIIQNENDEIVLNAQEPITIEILFKCFQDEHIIINKSFIKTILKKWKISTKDNSGNLTLYPIRIFDALQGHVDYGESGIPCYLFNGSWYVFDPMYDKLLAKEYEDLFDAKTASSEKLKKQFNLYMIKKSSEDAYNLSMKNNQDVILAHTVLINNVEISDAIFWDDSTLYLMHNKGKFDGNGVRDLTNQILTAAEYLYKKINTSERKEFLSEYYEAIEVKHPKAVAIKNITKEEFIQLFVNKKICFVAGYIEGLKKNTRSKYAQYLSVELNRKLHMKTYDVLFMKIY